jgi:hypothetical protein
MNEKAPRRAAQRRCDWIGAPATAGAAVSATRTTLLSLPLPRPRPARIDLAVSATARFRNVDHLEGFAPLPAIALCQCRRLEWPPQGVLVGRLGGALRQRYPPSTKRPPPSISLPLRRRAAIVSHARIFFSWMPRATPVSSGRAPSAAWWPHGMHVSKPLAVWCLPCLRRRVCIESVTPLCAVVRVSVGVEWTGAEGSPRRARALDGPWAPLG